MNQKNVGTDTIATNMEREIQLLTQAYAEILQLNRSLATLHPPQDITRVTAETRPHIFGTRGDLLERSAFPDDTRQAIKTSSRELSQAMHQKLRTRIIDAYVQSAEILPPEDDLAIYTLLGASITKSFQETLVEAGDRDIKTILSLKIAWDGSGEVGMSLLAEAITTLAYYSPFIYDTYFDRHELFFETEFGFIGSPRRYESVSHCPYQNFSYVFINELIATYEAIEPPTVEEERTDALTDTFNTIEDTFVAATATTITQILHRRNIDLPDL